MDYQIKQNRREYRLMDILLKIGISLVVAAFLGMLCALPIVFPLPIWLTLLIVLLVVGLAMMCFAVIWQD